MPEPTVNTPDQQPLDPGQQVPTTPPPPQGEDYKPRYDGAVRKIQELTETMKGLQGQLGEKSSLVEQLQGQLSGKDAEFDAVKGQHQEAIESLNKEYEQAQSRLTELEALQLKLEVAKELNHPELVNIFDTIPNVADKDAIKKVMETVINFASGQVQAREKELTAGVTPTGGTSTVKMPETEAEWSQKIGNLPDGSAEKQAAWDAYFEWARSQQQ